MKVLFLIWTVLVAMLGSVRAEQWTAALAKMPLAQAVPELNRSNAVSLMLGAFRENETVKGLIFLPGATDELFFFDRDVAKLTNAAPTLLDAITAYTNQTRILARFEAPFVLLYSKEDPQEPIIRVEHEKTAQKLAKKKFGKHAFYNDADWPIMKKEFGFAMNVFMAPAARADSANHFYRNTFAGWNLNGMEALRAIVLSGKTTVTVERGKLSFEPDRRFVERPEGNANRAQRLRDAQKSN